MSQFGAGGNGFGYINNNLQHTEYSNLFQFTKFVFSYEDYCLVTPPPTHHIFSNLLHIPTHGMAFNLVRDHY